MARERTDMRKSREILRHVLALDLTYELTQQSLSTSHGQVCRTLHKVRERGLVWDDVAPMSDEELEQLLYGAPKTPVSTAPLPDWPQEPFLANSPTQSDSSVLHGRNERRFWAGQPATGKSWDRQG